MMNTDRLREIQLCANALGKLTRTIPNSAGLVAQIWGEILDCYGLDETLDIIDEAFRRQHLVVTPRYPTFYVQHVKFYSQRYWDGGKKQARPDEKRIFYERESVTAIETEDGTARLSPLSTEDVRSVKRRRSKPDD